jgi:hypothetical protein
MAVGGCESNDRKAHNRSQEHLKQINISQEILLVSSTGKLKRIRALLPGATSSTPRRGRFCESLFLSDACCSTIRFTQRSSSVSMSDERMREIELPGGVCSLTLIKSRQYQSHSLAIGRRRSRRLSPARPP